MGANTTIATDVHILSLTIFKFSTLVAQKYYLNSKVKYKTIRPNQTVVFKIVQREGR